MVPTNIRIIFREFKKDKLYSSIKTGGFAIGIASCLLIALYIKHETSFDKHYKNTDRLFRVVHAYYKEGNYIKSTVLQSPLAQTIMDEFPEVEKVGKLSFSRTFGAGDNQIRRSDEKTSFLESGFAFADQALLEVMELQVISGDPRNALTQPNSIVITKTIADKFFPNEEAVGKSVILNENNTFTITAIIEDFPENSHMSFNFLMALYPDIFGQTNCWDCGNFHNYVLVKEGTDIPLLEKKLYSIIENHIIPYINQRDYHFDYTRNYYELQPVKDIHLKSNDIFYNASFDFSNLGDGRIVRMLGITALFILIIACINFVNLSTAKYSQRAKEIGLKKTVGATRRIIILQFFTESVLYSLLSILLAIGLTLIFLPYLNNLAGRTLPVPWLEWWLFPLLLFSTVTIGLFAGIYPSLFLSSFKPVKVLRGKFTMGRNNARLRNVLVVFQFAASIILIVGTLVIFKQMKFMLNKDLGFNKEQVILLHGTNTLGEDIFSFKDELESFSSIERVSISQYLPIENTTRNGTSYWNEGKQASDRGVVGQNWSVDYGYVETLGLRIVEGRNFSEELTTDTRAALVNQEMVRQLGLEDPIGKRIETVFAGWEIIGVVEDFHFDNMQYQIAPLLMRFGYDTRMMAIRINASDIKSTIKSITGKWNEFMPDQPIRYSFLNKEFAKMYDNVNRTGNLIRAFAVLAIIVALLGLYGLAEFITKERTKEIGVRKVNGARTIEILATINKSFAAAIFISLVIAIPIAYYLMDNWLQNFAYRTTINWWVFTTSGILTLGVAVLTVCWQSWRAAARNPVESLRYE